MANTFLTSALVMGVFLFLIALGIARARPWLRTEAGVEVRRPARQLTREPTTWVALFVLLVLVFGGGAVMLVSGGPEAAVDAGTVATAIIAAFGALLLGYLVLGVYVSAKDRGLKSSQAAALSSIVVGTLFLTAITLKLVLG